MSVKKAGKNPRETFTPAIPLIAEDEKTDFFMKNAHFNKSKTDIKGQDEKEIDLMSYRNVNIGAIAMQLHKDVCLSKTELARFNSKAKEHWLTQRKGAAVSKDKNESK